MSIVHLSVCLSVCPNVPLPLLALILSLSLSLSLSLIVSLSVYLSLPPYLSRCISLSLYLSPPSLARSSPSLYISLCIDLPAPHSRSYLSLVVSLSRSHCISLSVSLSVPRSLFVSLSLPSLSFSVSPSPLCRSLYRYLSLCLSLVTPEHTFLSPSTVYALSACYFESQVPPPGVAHIVFTAEGLRDGYKLSSISHWYLFSIYRVCFFIEIPT